MVNHTITRVGSREGNGCGLVFYSGPLLSQILDPTLKGAGMATHPYSVPTPLKFRGIQNIMHFQSSQLGLANSEFEME
jgi:hypothetical protein